MKATTRAQFEKIEKQRAEIIADITGLSARQLSFKPNAESWSVAQVIGHLVLAERLSLQYISKKISDPTRLTPPGWHGPVRLWWLKTMLVLPLKYKIPGEALGPDAKTPFEVWNDEWQERRKEFQALIEKLPDTVLEQAVFKHALAGRFTLAQMFDFMWTHIEHHRKQLDRIKNSPDFPAN